MTVLSLSVWPRQGGGGARAVLTRVWTATRFAAIGRLASRAAEHVKFRPLDPPPRPGTTRLRGAPQAESGGLRQ